METNKVIIECDTRFKWKSLKELARIMGEEWTLNQEKNGYSGVWAYTLWVAKAAHYAYTLYVDGKAVGFAALTVCNRRCHLIETIAYYFYVWFLVRNKKAYKAYCDTYENSDKKWTNKYDTNGDIIIVDKKYRGRGYGKLLMEQLLSVAKIHGKTMRIETYDTCAYQFHEKFGIKKVFEDKMIKVGDCDVTSKIYLGYVKEFA